MKSHELGNSSCALEQLESLGQLVGSAGVDSEQRLPGFDFCPYLLNLVNAHREVDEIRCLSPAAAEANNHPTNNLCIHLTKLPSVRG